MAKCKALTLWQPYAQAVAAGMKKYETRSWRTNYRGDLLIHASVRPISKEYCVLAKRYGLRDCPMGVIVGKVKLVDCILMTPEFIAAQCNKEIDWGDWQVGRYAWEFAELEVFKEPIPAKGRQGLWTWKS